MALDSKFNGRHYVLQGAERHDPFFGYKKVDLPLVSFP